MKRLGWQLTVCMAAVALGVMLCGSGCARPGASTAAHENDPNIIKLTGANFQKEVLDSGKPALVDFWAPWCGPCRTLAPTVAEIAAEYKDRVVVGKVNVDDEAGLAEKYRIEGIPAILIFKDGKLVQNLVGVRPKADYLAVLNGLVGPATAAPPSPSAAK